MKNTVNAFGLFIVIIALIALFDLYFLSGLNSNGKATSGMKPRSAETAAFSDEQTSAIDLQHLLDDIETSLMFMLEIETE